MQEAGHEYANGAEKLVGGRIVGITAEFRLFFLQAWSGIKSHANGPLRIPKKEGLCPIPQSPAFLTT
jgi:hypothetical protein